MKQIEKIPWYHIECVVLLENGREKSFPLWQCNLDTIKILKIWQRTGELRDLPRSYVVKIGKNLWEYLDMLSPEQIDWDAKMDFLYLGKPVKLIWGSDVDETESKWNEKRAPKEKCQKQGELQMTKIRWEDAILPQSKNKKKCGKNLKSVIYKLNGDVYEIEKLLNGSLKKDEKCLQNVDWDGFINEVLERRYASYVERYADPDNGFVEINPTRDNNGNLTISLYWSKMHFYVTSDDIHGKMWPDIKKDHYEESSIWQNFRCACDMILTLINGKYTELSNIAKTDTSVAKNATKLYLFLNSKRVKDFSREEAELLKELKETGKCEKLIRVPECNFTHINWEGFDEWYKYKLRNL